LLGSGVSGCHGPTSFDCELRFPGLFVAFQQLGNPKVKQFGLAVSSHQYIRRLQVTVNDKIRMCMGDGAQHI